jgi:hypothetical protein
MKKRSPSEENSHHGCAFRFGGVKGTGRKLLNAKDFSEFQESGMDRAPCLSTCPTIQEAQR